MELYSSHCDQPFSVYAKSSKKLIILTPWYANGPVHQGVRDVSFSETFAYVLNGWSHI